MMDGYTAGGAYVGSGYEIEEKEEYASLNIHDNLIIVFARCPHSVSYTHLTLPTT